MQIYTFSYESPMQACLPVTCHTWDMTQDLCAFYLHALCFSDCLSAPSDSTYRGRPQSWWLSTYSLQVLPFPRGLSEHHSWTESECSIPDLIRLVFDQLNRHFPLLKLAINVKSNTICRHIKYCQSSSELD